jgi:hypothetical protein
MLKYLEMGEMGYKVISKFVKKLRKYKTDDDAKKVIKDLKNDLSIITLGYISSKNKINLSEEQIKVIQNKELLIRVKGYLSILSNLEPKLTEEIKIIYAYLSKIK